MTRRCCLNKQTQPLSDRGQCLSKLMSTPKTVEFVCSKLLWELDELAWGLNHLQNQNENPQKTLLLLAVVFNKGCVMNGRMHDNVKLAVAETSLSLGVMSLRGIHCEETAGFKAQRFGIYGACFNLESLRR